MEFFQTLGSLVSRYWKEKNYNEENFPDVASRALSELPPSQHVSMWDVVKWATMEDRLPRQVDLDARFGDPPLSVYTGRKFRIEVLFWVQGTPAVHQHAFSGAFHVMHGSSIHSIWDFELREQIEARLLLGRVSFKRSEILFKGDSRPIFAGRRMYHSTYHLDRPTISVVIRTVVEENMRPQYSLLPPTVAHAPVDEIATVKRQKQLLRMLFVADRRAELNQMVLHLIGTKDGYSVFEFLHAIYHLIEDEEERQNLLLTAKLKHPALIDALQPVLVEEEIGNRILELYRAVDSAELKFFLALLRNIPERHAILALINQRFPGRDPIVAIVDWIRKLSDEGVLGRPFEEPWLQMVECLLRDCSDREIIDAFSGRHDGCARPPSAVQFRELCSGLQSSWLLRSLCLDNPFETVRAVPGIDVDSSKTLEGTGGGRKTLVAREQICAHEIEAPALAEPLQAGGTFRCFLDAQPEVLVPRSWLKENGFGSSAAWTVNPSLRFSATGQCPDPTIPFSDAVTASEPTVWVNDPITSLVNPFVLGPTSTQVVSNLHQRGEMTESVPPELLAQIIEAGLIYDLASFEAKRNEWCDSLENAKVRFEHGYAALGMLLHPFTLGAARAHFRQIIQEGRPRYGDGQTARRWNAHNEPVARFLHHQLTPIVEKIAGMPIKASYVYFASYHQSAKLPRHVDREQCEISLSMLIDYSPDLEAEESPWPLWLDTKDGSIAIHQRLGDTLIYRGRELPHYRHELPSGHTSTHLFFHFVPCDFSGPLD